MTEIPESSITEEELHAKMEKLMADYKEPDDEQLARFLCVQMYHVMNEYAVETILELFKSNPAIRTGGLARHREFQEDAYLLSIALEEVNNEIIGRLNG